MNPQKVIYGAAAALFVVALVLLRYSRSSDTDLPGWVWVIWLALFVPLLVLDLKTRRARRTRTGDRPR
ncbi:hypothetical protein [Actinomadura rubrisoli]|uniref:DUF4175 domain-containing protein n=1 Tax=Actinomadura rubrisoli TaxID=2530368 RepID=A0A4R5BDA2_9ACTN|nr:hypothetical protein [Actinomadura rubrisoli]TDD82760.1 hypothetical protein E1298_22180 [Actinomadura rubrisoli]